MFCIHFGYVPFRTPIFRYTFWAIFWLTWCRVICNALLFWIRNSLLKRCPSLRFCSYYERASSPFFRSVISLVLLPGGSPFDNLPRVFLWMAWITDGGSASGWWPYVWVNVRHCVRSRSRKYGMVSMFRHSLHCWWWWPRGSVQIILLGLS